MTDDSRSARPVDVFTPEAVQAVINIIRSDRKATLNGVATNLDIFHGTVYVISSQIFFDATHLKNLCGFATFQTVS